MKNKLLLKPICLMFLLTFAFLFNSITASSQALITSQQNVSFSKVVSQSETKSVNVRGSNLPVLPVLSNFEVQLSGANAGEFSVTTPPDNLLTLLATLLGGGYDLNITYHPSSAGTHTAKAIVRAKLVGLVNTLETEINLTGTATNLDMSAPVVGSSVPANNALGVTVNTPISVTYNEPVFVQNASLITINGVAASSSTSGNTLTINPGALANATTYQVVVGAGAVRDASNNLTTSSYSFSFTTKPSGNPGLAPSSQSVSFATQVSQSQTKTVNVKGSNILILNTISSFDVILSGPNANQFTVAAQTGSLGNVLSGLLGGGYDLNITYNPTSVGTHTATVTVKAVLLGIAETIETQITLTGTATSANLDTSAPVVGSSIPANNALGVAINTPISVTYNEPVFVQNASLITINGATASSSVSGNTLTINPGALVYGTTYQVVVGAGAVRDASNNLTTSSYSFSFTTKTSGNPGLNPSSQSVSFSTKVSQSETKTVNVKGSNILVLNTLSSFDAVISGPNANQFTVTPPSGSLGSLLNSLLGGGYDLAVTYHPTVAGTHTAKILVQGTFLGIAQTVETEITLTGVATNLDTSAPVVVATVPSANATDISLSTPVSVTYNEPITLANASLVTINGVAASSSVSGNTLTIIPGTALASSSTYQVTVGAGAVKDASNNSTTVSYTFSFTTTGSGQAQPDLFFRSGIVSLSTRLNVMTEESVVLTGSAFSSSHKVSNFSASITGADAGLFSVILPSKDEVVSAILAQNLSIKVQYLPTRQGPHTANLKLTLQIEGMSAPVEASIELLGSVSVVTGITTPQVEKNIISESFYTITGIKINQMTERGVYVKLVKYADGTSESVKVVKSKQ